MSSDPKRKVPSSEQGVEQRFDAEAVAGEEQGFAVAVPEGEGEHAAEAVDAAFAPGLPGVDDDFGVAAGVEDVAQRLQFRDEFLIVVDFAVEDDADALVFVVQRLLAGGQVDDRQAAVAEPDAGFDMQAAFVGAAMKLRFVHAVEHRTIDVAFASGVENAGYSAHKVSLSVPRGVGTGAMQEFIVGALVGGHHGVHAEFLFDQVASDMAHMLRGIRLGGEADDFDGHPLRVSGGDDSTAGAGRHQIGVAAYISRDHRQAGGHGFKNGVGDAFGQ